MSRHFSTIGFHTSFFLVGAFKTFYALVREKRCCCAHSERRCQLGGTDAGSRAQFGFIPMTSDDERREGGVDPPSGGFVPRCRPIGRHAFAIACGFARRAGKALTAGGFDPPSGGAVPRRRPFGRRALSSPVAIARRADRARVIAHRLRLCPASPAITCNRQPLGAISCYGVLCVNGHGCTLQPAMMVLQGM